MWQIQFKKSTFRVILKNGQTESMREHAGEITVKDRNVRENTEECWNVPIILRNSLCNSKEAAVTERFGQWRVTTQRPSTGDLEGTKGKYIW